MSPRKKIDPALKRYKELMKKMRKYPPGSLRYQEAVEELANEFKVAEVKPYWKTDGKPIFLIGKKKK